MSHYVSALRQVIEADLRRLNELEQRLKDSSGPEIESVVRTLGEVCDSLSAGLVKLAKSTDTLKEAAPRSGEPVTDDDQLELAARLGATITYGLCQCCQGVRAADLASWRAAALAPEYGDTVF